MARVTVRLDHDGMREMLQSAPVAAAVNESAVAVETAVTVHQSIVRHRMPVNRTAYTTDRAGEAVTIAHPGGLAVQAKYGLLTQAAASAGLDVTEDTE